MGPNDICFAFNTLKFSLISNIMPPPSVGLSKRNIKNDGIFKLALEIDGLNQVSTTPTTKWVIYRSRENEVMQIRHFTTKRL